MTTTSWFDPHGRSLQWAITAALLFLLSACAPSPQPATQGASAGTFPTHTAHAPTLTATIKPGITDTALPASSPTHTATSFPTSTFTSTATRAPTSTPTSMPSSTATQMPSPSATSTARPAPRLEQTFPIPGDQGVPTDAPLQLVFDQPMDTRDRTILAIEPAVEGVGEWVDPNRFVFRPVSLSTHTVFRLSLSRFQSAAGIPLDEPGTLSFATYPDGRVPLPVLMYHRVAALAADATANTREWSTSPEAFAAQMAYLESKGYDPVTLAAALDYLDRAVPLPLRPLCITFDDGYADFLSVAWPALRRHGFPVSLFVIPSHVGYGAFLSWADLSELAQSGVAIGSHTLDHVSLRGLDTEELTRQLQESKDMLEEHLGQPVTLLSYAYGGYDEPAIDAARSAGYVLGLTINPSGYQVRGRPFQMNRIHAPYDATLDDFAQLLP